MGPDPTAIPVSPADVDVVIPWVDGADPAHRQRLAQVLAASGAARLPGAEPTRFADCGELALCLASIIRHAPWLRRVHIVTDAQTPDVMATLRDSAWGDRVRLVDHREIFAGHERHLPTFNSRAIVTLLWRIPDLAERYLYFNDDFFLLRPLRPEDFFRGERTVLRGRWHRQSHANPAKRLGTALTRLAGRRKSTRAGNHAAQERAAQLAGFDAAYYRTYHIPYAFRRSAMEEFFACNPELLEANIRHRLRSGDQFLAEALATHMEIAAGRAELDNELRVAMIKPDEQGRWRLRHRLAWAARDPRIAFACVQSLDKADDVLRTEIMYWIVRFTGTLEQALALSSLRALPG